MGRPGEEAFAERQEQAVQQTSARRARSEQRSAIREGYTQNQPIQATNTNPVDVRLLLPAFSPVT